jgi:hypothetical protein
MKKSCMLGTPQARWLHMGPIILIQDGHPSKIDISLLFLPNPHFSQ